MTIEQYIRKYFLALITPPVRLLGNFNIAKFFGKNFIIDCIQIEKAKKQVVTGDAILSRTDYNASNLVVFGYWKHVGLIKRESDGVKVIEATAHGVVKRSLEEFMEGKSHVMIRRPLFCDTATRELAVKFADEKIVGLPYDWALVSGNKAYYCSEVLWKAYDHVLQPSPFTPRETLGELTVTPQDIADAKKKWSLVAQFSCYA